MSSENVWTWLQTKGKKFKVISNPGKGIIEVINEKGETLIRKTNLSRKQVEIVEKYFLNYVARKIKEGPEFKRDDNFDPMIA